MVHQNSIWCFQMLGLLTYSHARRKAALSFLGFGLAAHPVSLGPVHNTMKEDACCVIFNKDPCRHPLSAGTHS